jgi:orotate phosphoribosyltransferase
VEGRLKKNQRVLVIEDLVSTGGSSIKAVENVRAEGGLVTHCLAIFSYGMIKSKKTFEEARCELDTLTNLSLLLDYAVNSNRITPEERTIVLDWIEEPEEWGKKHGFE